MRKDELQRKGGGKSVKFSDDTPSNVTTKVEEKRRNDGVKKVVFTRK